MSKIVKVVTIIAAFLIIGSAFASPWAWVWYPGEWQKAPNMYFGRLAFNIDDEVKSAYVFVTGDNFTSLFLNGQNVGGSGDWYTLKPVTIKTLKPLLVKGKNVLAAKVQNDDYEGGFVLKGMILLADGKRIALDSNERWLCTNKAVEGWEKPDFDDSKWIPSECIGTPPAGSWGAPTMPPIRNLIGIIEIGNPESEKKFAYTGDGKLIDANFQYADGKAFTGKARIIEKNESFKIKPNAQGYIVLRRTLAPGQSTDLKVIIDGQDAGIWHSTQPTGKFCADAFFVVPYDLTNGKPEIVVTLTPVKSGEYASCRYSILTTFEWYMFDDSATGSLDRAALEGKYKAAPKDPVVAFMYGMTMEGERRWTETHEAYERCAQLLGEGDLAESANRGARLATAMNVLVKSKGDAKKLYDIGMYLKLNAFHAEAVEAFRESLKLKSAFETYDQLGEAMLYGGMPIKDYLAVWKEGLTKYPPKDTNAWTGIITLSPTKEQESMVEAQKEQLLLMQDMIYACSRGRMVLNAKYIVNPPPVEQLFGDGELDTYITVAGGAGGGSTLGPGVTYGHSGWSGFGFITPWDVAWHEWIHQLEMGIAISGNHLGWGGDHGSTQFGYRPPWWNWYRASMRYYNWPGQYQRGRLSDHSHAPYCDKWLVMGPFPTPDLYPEWICFPGKRTENKFGWTMRKTFDLAEIPAEAKLAFTGDNWCTTYVNSKRVGSVGSWMAAPTHDVTAMLRKGKNVIAISGLNEDYDGGILAHLMMKPKMGKNVVIVSDKTWKTNTSSEEEARKLTTDDKTIPDWSMPDFDDSKWVESEIIGRYPCGPWGVINIALPDSLMTENFAGASISAPSDKDGWKPVEFKTKTGKLTEIAPSKEIAYQSVTYAFAYIYSPADMRCQLAAGSGQRLIGILNGETVIKRGGGVTLPGVQPVYLKKGWNRLLLKVEDISGSASFWAKISSASDKAIPGLIYSNQKPAKDIVPDQKTALVFDQAKPKYYRWQDVAEDPYFLLPRLTAEDMAAYTGYKALKLVGGNNYLFIDLGTSKVPAGYTMLAAYAGGEHEANNALTWDYEPFAVIRCLRNGKPVDLLFIKPDAFELVFTTGLLKTASGAPNPSERLLGWVMDNNRLCIVAETQLSIPLGKTMDLLSPE